MSRTQSSSMLPPINLQKWIKQHREELRPPICAGLVYHEGGFIVMVIAGPNSRSDYHINMTNEFFYQLEGDITLKVVNEGRFEDVVVHEGEMFLMPPNMPHSPQRPAGTVGLVIERRRGSDEIDKLRWYCDNCQTMVYEEELHVDGLDLSENFGPVVQRYNSDPDLRSCTKCGYINVPKQPSGGRAAM